MIFSIGSPAKVESNLALKNIPSDMENVLYLASFAANSHNAQSWKLRISHSNKTIELHLDEKRLLDVVDPENRELYISLGCYIESLQTSFQAYGYEMITQDIAPNKENHYQVAIISYKKKENSKPNQETIDIIQQRHTDKRKYLSQQIDSKTITNFTKRYKDMSYYQAGSSEYNLLKDKSIEAMTEQTSNIEFLKEQDHWLRFSNKEVEEKKDGISGDMLGLNPILKSLYYLTTNHQNSTSQTFAKQSIDTLKNQVENSSGFFVITGNQTISDWIRVGRETQRFWYDCVKEKIAVQPISSIIEVPSIKEEVQNRLNLNKDIQMIFRVGYVKEYGENISPRRNLEEYISVSD
nr:hypothetical protein [Streptococcus panodentis]